MIKTRNTSRKEHRVTRLAISTRRWIASREGQQAIREALNTAHRATDQLAEVRTVSREALHEPVTR